MTRLTVLLAAVCLLAVGICLTAPAGAVGTVTEDPFGQMDIEADDVLMEASVGSDGDAVWTIEYRTRLETEEDRQAFEDLREDVEADPDAYTDSFRDGMETTVTSSAEATGREMSISNVTVSAERRDLPREYGVLTYQFRWAAFAAVDGTRITAGDALERLFLDEETAFIVSWPETYELVDATPSPTETRDRSIVWTGPIDFTDGEPRVTVDSDAAGGNGEGTGDGSGPASNTWAVLIGVVGLVIAVTIAVLWYRRHEIGSDGSGAGASATGSGSTESSGSAAGEDDGETDTDPGPDTSSDPDAETGSVGGTDAADAGSAGIDTELLSNEEQVLRLIEEHGGRMKQAQVAEALDWTAAKTSQVVTGLRDDGELDGFRLGRENVLSLPDDEE